jgi:hypothetical protein
MRTGDDMHIGDDGQSIRREELGGVRCIGEVLEELLERYRLQFPKVNVTMVEEPVAVT